jgi:hypothetical protein
MWSWMQWYEAASQGERAAWIGCALVFVLVAVIIREQFRK